jgi:uncharacterized protein
VLHKTYGQRVSAATAWTAAFALVAGAVLAVSAWAAIPADALLERLKPDGFVNDFAGILSPAQRQAMEQSVRDLQQKTGVQVAVVTLQSLEGGQIDDFAAKLFRRWGVGQKDKSNGVLVLVALKDRKARIEVGYGLEPILPDALAGRVLDEELFPAFRQGRHAEGLERSVRRVAEIITHNEPAPKTPPSTASDTASDWLGTILITLFLSPFVVIGFFFGGAGLGSKQLFMIVWGAFFGAFFGGIPFLIGAGFAAGGTIVPLVVLGCVACVAGVAGVWTGLRKPKSFRSGGKRGSTSGWTWGASGGGGSSSGGGFSSGDGGGGGFGGGSSGGGGASGSW